MTVKNAVRKLSKYGEVKKDGTLFYAKVKNDIVQFRSNGIVKDDADIVCIRVHSINDRDDSQSDYSAGVFTRNLTQAIEIALLD